MQKNPLPARRIIEMYDDINNGRKDSFTLLGHQFKVQKFSIGWKIIRVETKDEAVCPYFFSAMIEFQGIAACLLKARRSLVFNEYGNLITNKRCFRTDENQN